MITDATPMITPMSVRMERILLAQRDCSASLNASISCMIPLVFRPKTISGSSWINALRACAGSTSSVRKLRCPGGRRTPPGSPQIVCAPVFILTGRAPFSPQFAPTRSTRRLAWFTQSARRRFRMQMRAGGIILAFALYSPMMHCACILFGHSVCRGGNGRVRRSDGGGIDQEVLAELGEVAVPKRPVFGAVRGEGIAGAAQDLVPDVLRLPQVELEGQL